MVDRRSKNLCNVNLLTHSLLGASFLNGEFMNFGLLHGDCLELMKSLPDESVDAVVTDPPYGLSNHTDRLR